MVQCQERKAMLMKVANLLISASGSHGVTGNTMGMSMSELYHSYDGHNSSIVY